MGRASHETAGSEMISRTFLVWRQLLAAGGIVSQDGTIYILRRTLVGSG